MKDLAIVIVSCDKNAHLWSSWYHYFAKNFGFEHPVYILSETIECKHPNVRTICINMPNILLWTKKLRTAIKLIHEPDLFIMMDDFFIKRDVTAEIHAGYELFKQTGCDSIRFMAGPNKLCREVPTDFAFFDTDVHELTEDSDYKISWSPNIWKRSFLNKCIAVDESPWMSEVKGSMRVHDAYLLSVVLDSWYHGAMRNNKLTPEGRRLIDDI